MPLLYCGLREFSLLTLVAVTGGLLAVTFFAKVVSHADPEGELGEDDPSSDVSNGLGKHINWTPSLKEGLEMAETEDKPLMLIIHKSWCGACRALKPKIKESQAIGELSRNFVMVNTGDDNEPEGETYRPDGGYVPRIFFLNPKGELLKDVINEDGNPQYKYYYYDVESILSSMNRIVGMFQNPTDIIDQNQNLEGQSANNGLSENDKTEL